MMTQEERAKQFSAFDAMKGLQEALRDREERHARTERREISEYIKERNSKILLKLRCGDNVEIFFYRAFHDVSKLGTITDIDITFRYLELDGERIDFENIYGIKNRKVI